MSASFKISASEHEYEVVIEPGIVSRAKDALSICDAALVARLACDPARTIALPATEAAKDIASLTPAIAQLKQLGATREHVLYAIGGGVVQDVGCFLASIYMRGIKWVYFPTTLLGMVDSCIGGKSSINAGGYKNLVGTFHPPEAVYIDPNLAATLSVEQKVAGLCEAVKICYAHEGDYFERYLALAPTPSMDSATLAELIGLSLSAKKWFIEIDEFDRNERQLLNFGHTFGHAIEAATDFAISHGVAVGVGMLCALAYHAAGSVRAARLSAHVKALLREVKELPAQLSALDVARAVQKFTADKKHDAKHYWIIAPDADGLLRRVSLPKNEASLAQISALFETAKELYAEV